MTFDCSNSVLQLPNRFSLHQPTQFGPITDWFYRFSQWVLMIFFNHFLIWLKNSIIFRNDRKINRRMTDQFEKWSVCFSIIFDLIFRSDFSITRVDVFERKYLIGAMSARSSQHSQTWLQSGMSGQRNEQSQTKSGICGSFLGPWRLGRPSFFLIRLPKTFRTRTVHHVVQF